MKTFLKTVFAAIAIIAATNHSTAQIYEPRMPLIEPFTISVNTINAQLKDTGHTPLYESGGYVIIPPSYYKSIRPGSQGILVVQDWGNRYRAVDLRCTHCFYDYDETHKMDVRKRMLKCPSCGATVEGLFVYGSNQLEYDFLPGEDVHIYLDGYRLTVKKGKNDTTIQIDNTSRATPI